MPIGRKLVAEFIRTFFLVVTVGMAINPKSGAGATFLYAQDESNVGAAGAGRGG